MTKEALLIGRRNHNYALLLFLCFLNFNCKSQEYDIEKAKSLNPTHIVKSDALSQLLNNIETNKKLFDESSNVIILYLEKKKKKLKISATKTDFELFKENKSEYYFSNIKGYLMHFDYLVLLYGDVDNSLLFDRTKNKLEKNIMSYKKDKDDIPIIYEPTFLEYRIEEGKLIELDNY